jgi:hypothetical protein
MGNLLSEDWRDLILSVGTHHGKRRLSPIEVAEKFEIAKRGGIALRDIADKVRLKDVTMVAKFIRLLDIIPEIRYLIDWGQSSSSISFSAAAELARLDKSDQKTVADAILEHGLTKNEVRQIIQLRNKLSADVNKCIYQILELRPQIIRKHIFVGAVLDNRLLCLLSSHTQAERDELLLKALEGKFSSRIEWSGKLGKTRFSIVGSDQLAQAMNKLVPDFERTINIWLMEEAKIEA